MWPPSKLIIILPRLNWCVLDKLRTIIPILKEMENNCTRFPLSSQLRLISQTSSQDTEPCYVASTSPRATFSLIQKAVGVIGRIASRRGTCRTSTCSWREVSVVTGPSRPSHATIFKSARESRNSSADVLMPMTTANMSSSRTSSRLQLTATPTMKTSIITTLTKTRIRTRKVPVTMTIYKDTSVCGRSWPWCSL